MSTLPSSSVAPTSLFVRPTSSHLRRPIGEINSKVVPTNSIPKPNSPNTCRPSGLLSSSSSCDPLPTTANIRASSLESFSPIPRLTLTSKKTLTVRALFDYDPSSDTGLPGRGLEFRHGDILHVVNATDQEWWQARRLILFGSADQSYSRVADPITAGSSHLTTRSPLGIIPSRQRVERRQRSRLKRVNFFSKVTVIGSNSQPPIPSSPFSSGPHPNSADSVDQCNNHCDQLSSSSSCVSNGREGDNFLGLVSTLERRRKSSQSELEEKTRSNSLTRVFLKRFSSRNRRKDNGVSLADVRNTVNLASEADVDSLRSYEIVSPITIKVARPLLVFGPLKERVIDSILQDPRFATCVPHTSRPPRPGERDGVDYHFVESKAKMEEDIKSDRFVEVGQYQDHYYATSIEAVRHTLQTGRVCVLDVGLTAIRRLELAGLFPISVLLKPLSASHLRAMQRRLTDDQAKRSVDFALRLEADNWRSFSTIVSFDSVDVAVNSIRYYVLLHGGPVIWVPSGMVTHNIDELSNAGSQSSTLPRSTRGLVGSTESKTSSSMVSNS